MRKNKKIMIAAFIFLLFSAFNFYVQASNTTVIIYGNEKCDTCLKYMTELHSELLVRGITDIKIRYLGIDVQAVRELSAFHDRIGLPMSMRGSVAVIIDEKFVFEGYVPIDIISDFVKEHKSDYNSFVLYRDSSRNIYKLMDDGGEIRDCEIINSIEECLPKSKPSSSSAPILPLILVSGLLDGINPCAFAVLLFFLAFLFRVMQSSPMGKVKRRILEIGAVYISSIYITYLLIGIGFLNVITLLPFPNLIAAVGALLVIALGAVSIKDYFFSGKGMTLKIPQKQWKMIAKLMHKATVPSTFIIGFIVALFEFPCTGGIYIAILGMLAVKTTQVEGFTYLLIYNIAFVIPLIAILAFASNGKVVERLREWQKTENKKMKLLIGLFMISIGAIILFFLV